MHYMIIALSISHICLVSLITNFITTDLAANKLCKKDRMLLQAHVLQEGPIKKTLDEMFRDTTNPVAAFKHAGCHFIKEKSRAIALHPDLPDWILKAVNYDNQYPVDGFVNLISSNRNAYRVIVNQKIRSCIKQHNLKHIIAPQKYLYHIPNTPLNVCDAHYVVVAQKLDLLCSECNRHQFAHHLSKEQEQEVLLIIKAIGYGDAALRNICFTTDLKIAFIDTEQIYSADLLESIGLTKIIRTFAGSRGIKKFKKELQRIRPVVQTHTKTRRRHTT